MCGYSHNHMVAGFSSMQSLYKTVKELYDIYSIPTVTCIKYNVQHCVINLVELFVICQ